MVNKDQLGHQEKLDLEASLDHRVDQDQWDLRVCQDLKEPRDQKETRV